MMNSKYMRKYIQIGAYLGKKVVNSELGAFVLGSRSEVCIMDIQKMLFSVYRALYVLKKVLDDSGHISILNTNLEFSPLVKRIAHTIQSSSLKVKGSPLCLRQRQQVSTVSYCNEKWLGGTLTNWEQISKSLEVFARLRRSLASCELANYVDAAHRVRAVRKKKTLLSARWQAKCFAPRHMVNDKRVSPGSHRKTNPRVTKMQKCFQGFAPIQKVFDQRKWNRIRVVIANNSLVV